MSTTNVTLSLRALATGYGRGRRAVTVAHDLTADLHEGELTCLLGPNGAGKSTLLRTIAAFQPPLQGSVSVLDRPLRDYDRRALAHALSVVLTDNAGIKNLTAAEVIALGRAPHTGFFGRLSSEDRHIIGRCLDWTGTTALGARRMQTLSDGERQKVMIAKAIAQQTPVILLDEPTAYLDYPSKVSMALLLHRLAKALRKTILLSTHDLELALQTADQLWLLDRDHGLTAGAPEDLCADGSIERYFHSDGIRFDPRTCTFGVTHEATREIILTGDPQSLRHQLAARAFARCGVRAIASMSEATLGTTSAGVEVRVDADTTLRLVEHGTETAAAHTIAQILPLALAAAARAQ